VGAHRAIWTVAATGGDPVRVTEPAALDWSPAWSPDGWLYWSSDRGGTMGAWRTRVGRRDGRPQGAPQPMALPSRYASQFSFAASGAMAFAAQSPTSSVWSLPLEPGRQARRLTPATLHVLHPSVSPDGEWLVAFEETPDDNLVLFRADGSDFRNLTDGPFRDRGPAWSPAGDVIVFLSNRGGSYHLWRRAAAVP
jgi:Tol biopolymer transport system component